MHNLYAFFRKRGADLLLLAAFLFLFLYPGARPWLMRRMFDIGLFKPELATVRPSTGKQVASFRFNRGKNVAIELSSLKGKWVLLNFWAPWCPPCRAELPSLQELSTKSEKSALVILLVDMEGDQGRSAKLLEQMNITVPNVFPLSDPDTALFTGTLPTTVLLDPAGKLVWKHEGLANYNHPHFLQQLRAYMSQNPG